ncbi:hypothetical protein [Niastella populi]|uniref:Fibronectin type-III domain-containing protein n=1 Tax=Niastella populi TaxID=550983 RepID=A0A1V9EUY1_9BACT|nr:hypothetical protein [Niastella populi]OQP49967.1 hypothetical protein A4R26_30080 [Niastella populi]
MEAIILKTYKRERDSELGTLATRVVEGMDNNPTFPDAPPELAQLRQKLPDYQLAVANAKGRDSVAVSIKKDLKAQIVGCLTSLDAYVTSKCKGDRTMLLTSGFLISGEKGEVGEPTINKLNVELGPPGIVTTSIKRVARSRAYFHQYATEPPASGTSWHSESSLQPKFTFSGLTSGRTYWLRVAIISSSGQWVYSPVESRIVQ